MKKILLLSITIVLILGNIISSAQTEKQAKLQAYYFHNATRCVTCKTVEAEAKTDLKELYGENVTFQALNLEDKATQELAKKLKVSGQTLLVTNGKKQVNLTNDGFLYAVTNPNKFKSIIKEKVDPLVN